MRYRINYREGDWFAVPLENGGWALGLVARAKRGCVLGYFFGPRRARLPTLGEAAGLAARDAVDVHLLGDLGLVTERWPNLGRLEGWRSDDWPLPPFGHVDVVDPGLAWLRIYDQPDISGLPREIPVGPDVARRFPRDGLAGEGAVVSCLDQILPEVDRPDAASGAGDARHEPLARE